MMSTPQLSSWLSIDASPRLNDYSHFCKFIFPKRRSSVGSIGSASTLCEPTPASPKPTAAAIPPSGCSSPSPLPSDSESSLAAPVPRRARRASQPSLMLALDCITCNTAGAISLSSCMPCLTPPSYNTDHSRFRGRRRAVSDALPPSPTAKGEATKDRGTSEEAKTFECTKARVEKAAAAALDVSLDVFREALYTGSDLLSLAPVAGLQEVVKTLLTIWDNCQQVERNRTSCLRLTQRCADILLRVKGEIDSAGQAVTDELHEPIDKLTEAFVKVQELLQRQVQRHLFARYLKREEIVREIGGCDSVLGDALEMFSLAIQIRILKQIQANEARRQRETECLFQCIRSASSHSEAQTGAFTLQSPPAARSPKSRRPPALSVSPTSTPPMTPEPLTPTSVCFQNLPPMISIEQVYDEYDLSDSVRDKHDEDDESYAVYAA